MSTPAPTPPDAHQLSFWRRLVLLPLGLLAQLWGRSLRFETTPEDVRNFSKTDEPVAFLIWHNRLFLVAEVHRRYRARKPIYGLVSASKDGAWLAAFFSLVGILSVRGSSSRRGREAAHALVDVVRHGYDIGITPDGPRGPMYDLKRGGLVVAQHTGAPALLLGGEFTSAWRLGSWDGFYLPKPFSRVRMRCELVPASELGEAAAEAIKARMLAINPDPPDTGVRPAGSRR